MKTQQLPRLFSLFQSVTFLFWIVVQDNVPSAVAQCIRDFQEIYDQEATVIDTSIPRLYVVCPYQIFEIADLDFNYDPRITDDSGVSTSPPMPLRPNINIRCGDDGSSSNLCWISGGDIQIDGTSMVWNPNPTVENVVIEGFVFIDARRHSLFVTKPGSIIFRDCEWRDFNRSKAPIMLDYFDALADNELVAIFKDCKFYDNRYFGSEAYSALIFGNSDQNRLIVETTTFENNDMIYNNTKNATNSFLIESLGPICIDRGCFINNLVGSSDIAVFGSSFESSQVYVSNSSGAVCSFASSFQEIEQFRTFSPLCIEAMADGCNFTASEPTCVVPTPTPSQPPSTPSPSLPETPNVTISFNSEPAEPGASP